MAANLTFKLMLMWIAEPLFLYLIAGLLLGAALTWLLMQRGRKSINEIPKNKETLLYRQLFEEASDPIMITDFDGNIKEVNSSLCSLLDYSRSELLNIHISLLVDPENLKNKPLMYSSLRKGEHIFNERPMLKKDGSVVWVDANVKKITENRILAIARDITDRKRIEAELQESEAKFRDLAEKSMIGFYIIQHGKFQYVNLRFAEMFGYGPQELIDSYPVEILITEEDRHITLEHLRVLMEGQKQSVHYEVRGCRKDESSIVIEIFSSMTRYKGKPAIIGSVLDITDRKNATDLVLKEKNFSESIIRTLPGIFLVRNMEGKFLTWNENFEQVTGYTVNEILESEPYSFIVAEDRERIRSIVQTIHQEGSVLNAETELLKKDGSKVPVYFTGTSFNWEGQLCIMATAIDVSRRRQAEEELRLSEEMYKLLFKSNPLPMLMVSKNDMVIISVNNAAADLYGYSQDELLSMTLKDIRPAEDIERLVQTFSIKATEPENLGIWRHQKKDGTLIFVQVIVHDISYKGKEVRLAVINDMTQRLKDEEEIQRSRTNLHSILNTTDVAYTLFNKDFEIVTFNQRAADFAERELKVKIKEGVPILQYVPANKTVLWEKLVPELLQGKHFEFERSYEQPGGSFNWYQIKLFSVTDSVIFLGVVASINDITDRKEDEMHREKITGDLLQRNQDLEQFTYIVSHNLRAPVTNILGICSILKNENLQHTARLNFENILNVSVTQLDTVIKDLNQILQVSREISERKDLVEFQEVVENIKSSIHTLIEKENVRIITDFSKVKGMSTLRTYLHSIFFNLISNSIRFRQANQTPLIQITAKMHARNITLSFKDNGTGIDLQKHGHEIFGLYNRFHAEVPGKGIGLFMVKTQVQILGGTIQIQSEPNQGTELTIEFPEAATE